MYKMLYGSQNQKVVSLPSVVLCYLEQSFCDEIQSATPVVLVPPSLNAITQDPDMNDTCQALNAVCVG